MFIAWIHHVHVKAEGDDVDELDGLKIEMTLEELVGGLCLVNKISVAILQIAMLWFSPF